MGKQSMYQISTIFVLLSILVSNLVVFSRFVQAATSQNDQSNSSAVSTQLSKELQRDAYFLTKLSGKEPATDSASAATAISTGYKTDDDNLAWKPSDPVDGKLTTIAEKLRSDYGFAIGVASTVQFSHATTAAFAAHNVNRNNYSEIAREIVDTVKPEVVIGGGHPTYFAATPDYSYVGDQATWNALKAGTRGYTLVERTAGVDGGAALITASQTVNLAAGGRLMGVFGGPGGNFEYNIPGDAPGKPAVTRGNPENPTLANVTTAALNVLGQDDNGFFVMFEQGTIDWANHANNYKNMVGGVWDLDQAVRSVQIRLDNAVTGQPSWSDTLVIVTAGYSNDYMRLPYPLGKGDLPNQVNYDVNNNGKRTDDGDWIYPNGEVTYRTTNHTNELVTLWARGAGAGLFNTYANSSWYPGSHIVDNTQIYKAMLEAVQTASVKHVILFIGDGMNVQHEIAASRYLYGKDFGLAWYEWGGRPNTFAGYSATWDVTTYNKYAGAVTYAPPVTPASLGANIATTGYDPSKGGLSPFTTESYPYLPDNLASNVYYLTKITGKEPATDSASAGTALSTGFKTNDGNLAWKPSELANDKLTTIAETLRAENGFAIGIASTVQFSHATPASFASHNVNRDNYSQIADEIINAVQPEVVIGGGHPLYFGATPDYNYVGGSANWNKLLSYGTPYLLAQRLPGVNGATTLANVAANVSLANNQKLMGVYGGFGGGFEYNLPANAPGAPAVMRGSTENPTLKDVTQSSLQVLRQDPDGFFVMFEQGNIDWANHANNFQNMVGEIWDLDQAVRSVQTSLDNPAAGGPSWNDTLVIVTADHSNDYLRLPGWLGKGELPQQDNSGALPTYPNGEVIYSTGNHTNELVTLAARGKGANLFNQYAGTWFANSRILDNTQVYQVMLDAVKKAGAKHVILFIGDGMNIEHEIASSRYLYGVDMGLAWHNWRMQPNGWSGYVATWDVTTYNKYASIQVPPAAAFVSPASPVNLGSNNLTIGYNVDLGGYAPFQMQSDYALISASAFLYAELSPDKKGTQTLTINKAGSANPAWTLSEANPVSWLSEPVAEGVLVSDGAYSFTVNFDATGLTPAFYNSRLLFHTRYGDTYIPVTLKVKQVVSVPQGSRGVIATYLTSFKDPNRVKAGAEMVTYDPVHQYVIATNAIAKSLDILDLKNIKTAGINLVKRIALTDYSTYGATSVDYSNGLIAVAVPASNKTDPGKVYFYNGIDDRAPVAVTVGSQPNMLTFSPDGKLVVVANEGEPNHYYITNDPINDPLIDPLGSISIIDLTSGVNSAVVTTLDFSSFTAATLDPRIRIFGPNASIAQDMEPESVTVSADSKQAWVTLQENNAFAFVDLTTKQITKVTALGFKDWSTVNGLDASDRDNKINITNWPVQGIYMPDEIANYTVNGQPYLMTANEGNARYYTGTIPADYNEEIRINSIKLDPTVFPNAATLQLDANLGRLQVTSAGSNINSSFVADPDKDGLYENLYTFGGRSFSIWNGTTGSLVYDSGDQFEEIIAARYPTQFNINPGSPAVDARSYAKGPEPKTVTIVNMQGRTYGLIVCERSTGGFMVYDLTRPNNPVFVTYAPSDTGDLLPTGLKMIPDFQSPTGKPLVVLANQGSGSISVYEIWQISLKTFLPVIKN
jgi:alkaline phosphatase